MLQESFLRVYEKLKSEFCRQVFALVRERRGSLSAMEAFSLEVIRQLGRPTVSQFAAFLNISSRTPPIRWPAWCARAIC